MFWAEIWKVSEFLSENFSVFGGEIFNIFEKACFRNAQRQQVINLWATKRENLSLDICAQQKLKSVSFAQSSKSWLSP